MLRDDEIECLSDEHILYMTWAIVGLGLYYPMSTFFFPNFQFQDKALDVKYNPSFIILQIQAKLIISGLGSLFSSFSNSDFPLILQVSSTSIALFILALASAKMKPCLIKKINLWDTGLYLLVSYMNGCALFVLLTYNSIVGVIALSIGGPLILIGTIYLHRRIYGPFFSKSKVNPENENNGDEDEDMEKEKKEEKDESDELEESKELKNKEKEEEEEKEKNIQNKKKRIITIEGAIVKDTEIYKF